MEPLNVLCPQCKARLRVQASGSADKRVVCPKCRTQFMVRAPTEQPPAAASPLSELLDEETASPLDDVAPDNPSAARSATTRVGTRQRGAVARPAHSPWKVPALIGGGVGLVLFVAAVIGFVLWRGGGGTGSARVWAPDPIQLANLGAEAAVPKLGWDQAPGFSLRPPAVLADASNTGTWMAPRPGGLPFVTLAVSISPRSPALPNQSPEDRLKQALANWSKVLQTHNDGWKEQSPEFGLVDGLSFGRFAWRGTDKQTKQDMRGFVVVHVGSNFELSIRFEDRASFAAELLPVAEAAALTIRQVTGPAATTVASAPAAASAKPAPPAASPPPAASTPASPPAVSTVRPASDLPVWTPDAALLAKLDAEAPLPGEATFRLRTPNGFKQVQSQASPAQTTALVDARGGDQSGGLTITVMLAREKTLVMDDRSVRELFDGALMVLRNQFQLQNWRQSPPEFGQINGLRFARTRWSGIVPGEQVNFQGFTYVTYQGRTVITLTGMVVDAPDDSALKMLETSVLTCRKPGP